MDPRQQNQDFQGNSAQRVGANYSFNGAQNDTFSTFVNTDNDNAFDPPWNSQAFPSNQQPVNGFDQGNHGWQQHPYQTPNLLSMNNYGIQPRDYEQPFSRSPAPFDYSGFDSTHAQTFSPSAYDTSLNFGQIPLSNNPQYDYAGQQGLQQQQHHDTISPQALQNYSTSFTQPTSEDSRPPQTLHYGSTLPLRRASNTEAVPYNQQDWVTLASAMPESIVAKGMHIKPTVGLINATKSIRLDGFTFVGNGTLASSATKATVPKIKRRRSLKEFRRLLEAEKGTDPWHRDREPVLKKLKVTENKLSGPRSATRSPQARPGNTADSVSPSESSDSDSDDDSEYYSESDVGIEPEEPSPLPATRPADPSKAVEYDVIKAVWAKKSTSLSGTVIRTALTEYWDIFKGIRDKWKIKSNSLQQAIEKKDQANSKTFERRVLEQRRLLESCIRLTLKHGHPDIIEKLGENPAFLLIFYQFLADRFKDSEYTGSLVASMLELMTRCVTIDQSILEKTKMDKALPRLVRRGDDQGKKFAQEILDNAASITKQKATGGKTTSNGVSTKPSINGPRISDANEAKTARPEVKKPSTTSNKSSNTTTSKSANSSDARQATAKADAKSTPKVLGTESSNKPKANVITTKPSAFFSSLKSASKKPGTSSKLEDGKPSTGNEVKAEVVTEPPKPAFSFSATMANLHAQKDAAPVKAEETRKPETPEEKRKRLRKEERRKLRVSFKPDDVLVQIREFVHDPEEELGHEDSQVRDVGDSRGEGQMLKMHKDLEFMDEDEDYEPPEEVLPDWYIPTAIDFSVIEAHELARNYTSRGGNAEITSEERAMQEQRELTKLMVVYSSNFDIPPSPREPSDLFSGEHSTEESFGSPREETKERETQYYLQMSSQRSPAELPQPDISSLLRIISQQQQTQPVQQPQPVVPPPATGLEAIFAQFAQVNQQQAPNMQMPQPVQQQAPSFDLHAALAGLQQSNQAPSPYNVPQPPQVPDLASILAQVSNQPAPQVPQMQGYGFQNQYQNGNDRKRQYDQDEADNDYNKSKRARGGGGPEKKKFQYHGPPRLPCKFWQEGKCRKGDECTYLHE